MSRFARGSALSALASSGEALSALVVAVLVARRGGPEALGQLAAATAWMLGAVSLLELGQNVVLTRRTAARSSDASTRYGASLVLKSAGGLSLAPVVIAFWPAGEPWWGGVAGAVYVVLSALAISATAVLRGGERFGAAAAASLGSGLLAVGAVAVQGTLTLSGLVGALAGGQLVKLGVAVAALPADSRARRPGAADVRGLVAETLPFAGLVLASVAFLKADVVIVAALAGVGEAGAFASAARLLEPMKILPAAMAAALLPALAAGREAAARGAVRAAGAFGLAVVALSVGLGPDALGLVFGPEFAGAAGPLRLLSIAFALGAVNTVLAVRLYARAGERWALGATVVALAVKVVLALALAPAAGALGSAAAALLAEAALAGLYTRALVAPATPRGALVLRPGETAP